MRHTLGARLAVPLALFVAALSLACGDSGSEPGAATGGSGASAGRDGAGSGTSGGAAGGNAGAGAAGGNAGAGAAGSAGASAGSNPGAGGSSSGAPNAGSPGAAGSAGSSAGASGAATGGSPGAAGATSGGAAGGAQTPYKGVANSACADLARLGASWWYNWTQNPGSCAHREFVPMISGKNEKTASAVSDAVTRIANAGYTSVLGFNEPNKADQANLSIAQVLSLWPALTSNTALRVGSPATSADAQSWFTDFMTQASAQGLRNDFIAVHWYGWNAGSCDGNAATFESYIRWAEALPGNRPIWITEWGCMHQSNPDARTVEAFFSGALTMLARHPRVERYAWYPWNTHNELVDSSGNLTALGTLFANAPALR